MASKNFLKLSLLYVKKVGPHHFYNRKSGPRRKKFGHPCFTDSCKNHLPYILILRKSVARAMFSIYPDGLYEAFLPSRLKSHLPHIPLTDDVCPVRISLVTVSRIQIELPSCFTRWIIWKRLNQLSNHEIWESRKLCCRTYG